MLKMNFKFKSIKIQQPQQNFNFKEKQQTNFLQQQRTQKLQNIYNKNCKFNANIVWNNNNKKKVLEFVLKKREQKSFSFFTPSKKKNKDYRKLFLVKN